MKASKQIVEFVDFDIDIVGITLLSEEEYNEFQSNIKAINDWWWLRSPGNFSNYASRVINDGSLSTYFNVGSALGSVRPALIYESANLSIGDTIRLFDYNWTVISDKYILCDESLCFMAFRYDYKSVNANMYESSDVKKYLDNWLDKHKE